MDERIAEAVKAAFDEKVPTELETAVLENMRRELMRRNRRKRFSGVKIYAAAASIAMLFGVGILGYREWRAGEFAACVLESEASVMLEIVGMASISDFYGNFADES